MFQKLLDKVNKVNNLAQKIEQRKKNRNKTTTTVKGVMAPLCMWFWMFFSLFFRSGVIRV